jgi:hypothetical protein
MNIFSNRFNVLLEASEDESLAPPMEPTPETEAEALGQGLDGTVPPEAVDDVGPTPEHQIEAQRTQASVGTIREWIDKVENFIEWCNGLSPDSVNSILNSADCDDILNDVRRTESKKISRLAQDLSSFSESLKQYLLSAQSRENDK